MPSVTHESGVVGSSPSSFHTELEPLPIQSCAISTAARAAPWPRSVSSSGASIC
jgi:hypothetical protein